MAADMRGRIPVTDRKSFQILDVNLESRFDKMSQGRLCSRQISHVKICLRSLTFFLSTSRGMKCAIFQNWSMTTHNSVQLFNRGWSVLTSIAIDCQSAYGSLRENRSPYYFWHWDLSLWWSEHSCMYFSIWGSIPEY